MTSYLWVHVVHFQYSPSLCQWQWDNRMIVSMSVKWSWKILAKLTINTLRPRQDGRYFADDILKCIFLNENAWISLKIPLMFVPGGPINNIPALVQIMAWRRPGDKPLSEPMLVFVPTHICVTRPQWVNRIQIYVTMSYIIRQIFSRIRI